MPSPNRQSVVNNINRFLANQRRRENARTRMAQQEFIRTINAALRIPKVTPPRHLNYGFGPYVLVHSPNPNTPLKIAHLTSTARAKKSLRIPHNMRGNVRKVLKFNN
jgi:hypothetical protein